MNFRKKTSNVTKALYIILAMCIISIISLTLYSLFNQGSSPNNQILHINNQEDEAEDALGNIFRRREETTQETSKPPETTSKQPEPPPAATQRPETPAHTPPPAASNIPAPSAPAYLPEIDSIETDDIEVIAPPEIEEQPAFINPELEESVEVMSVPSVFMKPLNGFISRVHNPNIPEYSVAMNDYRTHAGIDIDGEIGANVRAVANGTVSEIRDDPLMGKTIVISHADGVSSIYMNLQTAVPQNIIVGAQIKAGDVIGGVGQSALIEMTDVPHLHFEMQKDGVYVDPRDYIDFS